MKEWYISDTHFGHANIIDYEGRPFKNAEEMDEAIIKNWNSVVSKEDMVFHLGDFSFRNKYDTSEIVSRLNGRIVLIKGNHDTHSDKWYLEVGIYKVVQWPIIRHGFLILSHEPMYLEHSTPYRNIHGHVHGIEHDRGPILPREGYYFNACVEKINYTPVSLEYIGGFLDTSDMVKRDETETEDGL